MTLAAINPGFRTRRDYAADLGVLPRFQYLPARRVVVQRLSKDTNLTENIRASIIVSYALTAPSSSTSSLSKKIDEIALTKDKYQTLMEWNKDITDELKTNNVPDPLAMAVSPLADMDIADEASSLRSQQNLALSLAGLLAKAGLQAQAAVFEQYAHRQERDARSRTALVAINTYSAGGGLFGWQVGPRFRAMEDPEIEKSGAPAHVLDRQTFPALIMIGVRPEDLYPRMAINHNGTLTVYEPVLSFVAVSRWLPLKKGCWISSQKRYTETEHLEDGADVLKVSELLQTLADEPYYAKLAYWAKSRLESLQYHVFDNESGQLFDPQQVVPSPPEPVSIPAISGIYPTEISLSVDEKLEMLVLIPAGTREIRHPLNPAIARGIDGAHGHRTAGLHCRETGDPVAAKPLAEMVCFEPGCQFRT